MIERLMMSNVKNILLLGQSKSGKTSLAAIICDFLHPIGYAEDRKYFDLDAENSVIPGTTIQGSSVEYRRLNPNTKTPVKRNIIDCKKQTDLPALLSAFKFDAAIWVIGRAGTGWDDMQQLALARLFKIPYIAICINANIAAGASECFDRYDPQAGSAEELIELTEFEASNLVHNEIGLASQIKLHKAILEQRAQQLALEEEEEETTNDGEIVKNETSKDILTAEQIQALLEQLPSDEACDEINVNFDHRPYKDQITLLSIDIGNSLSLTNRKNALKQLLDVCLETHFNQLS